MKKILYVTVVALLAACSSPRHTANFQKSDVNTGYHPVKMAVSERVEPSKIQPDQLVASTSKTIMPLAEVKKEVRISYLKMSKAEQKEVRQQLKRQIKTIVKVQKKEMSVNSTQAAGMDHDLKLAAIFGAVGVVGLLLGSAGQAFVIIGAIALLIGVVFFIKWLVRQ